MEGLYNSSVVNLLWGVFSPLLESSGGGTRASKSKQPIFGVRLSPKKKKATTKILPKDFMRQYE